MGMTLVELVDYICYDGTMSLELVIQAGTIPHEDHRYPTVGDWWIENDALQVRVSKTKDPRHALLVAIHEIIEATLCHYQGIAPSDLDDFDQTYEKARAGTYGYPGAPDTPDALDASEASDRLFRDWDCTCNITRTSEPGNDWHAPYHRQHMYATEVERDLAKQIGVDWDEYIKALDDLDTPTASLQPHHCLPLSPPSVAVRYEPQDAPPNPNYSQETCPLACPFCGSRVLIDSACPRCGWDCPTC